MNKYHCPYMVSISGTNTWKDVEAYGQAKESWLKTFLTFSNSLPSHNTLGRVFARLDPEVVQASFPIWVEQVVEVIEGVLPIDRNPLRHSYERAKGGGMIHIVSA